MSKFGLKSAKHSQRAISFIEESFESIPSVAELEDDSSPQYKNPLIKKDFVRQKDAT
jgi:hypothetical protein